MPTVRCETRRQHVVPNHRECLLAVPLAIAIGGLLDISVGRLPPTVEPLGDKDEYAADDRGTVPGGDSRINPGRYGR